MMCQKEVESKHMEVRTLLIVVNSSKYDALEHSYIKTVLEVQ